MEVTKREIIVSIAIVCIMLIFGIMISNKISNDRLDKIQEYNTALQIPDNNSELFKYAMKTNVGNSFVEGQLIVTDPVSIDGLDGQYSYISRELEKYTQHTRVVTRTTYVNGKAKTTTMTEIYWTWDHVKTDRWESKYINFNGVDFSISQISLPGTYHHSTVRCGSNRRYVYYVRDIEWQGTIYGNLKDNTIQGTAEFFNKYDIAQVLDKYISFNGLYIFWPLWIILIIVMVIIFYYIDNCWLE